METSYDQLWEVPHHIAHFTLEINNIIFASPKNNFTSWNPWHISIISQCHQFSATPEIVFQHIIYTRIFQNQFLMEPSILSCNNQRKSVPHIIRLDTTFSCFKFTYSSKPCVRNQNMSILKPISTSYKWWKRK